MIRIQHIILVLFIGAQFFHSRLWAQNKLADPISKQDSIRAPLSAIIRSTIVPGWGQIYQERLINGAFFYAASGTFYYRSLFHINQYNKGNSRKHYNLFRSNLSVAIFFHLLNLMDVTDAAYHESPKGWQGELLGDEPLKSPWGATLRSAILPGWGQLYNESYLKAAGYLLIDGYLFYRIRQADIHYRDSKETKYLEDRSRYSWYFGVAYFLTMADAYAGAYLYKFEEAMQVTVVPAVKHQFIGVQACVMF